MAARLVAAPIAAVCLTSEAGTVLGASGVAEPVASRPETVTLLEVAHRVARTGAPVAVRDALSVDAWQAGQTVGIRSWLAYPLFGSDGAVTGAVVALDRRDRLWTAADVEALADISALATEETRLAESAVELDAASALIERQESTIRAFFDTTPLMMGMVEVLSDDVVHRLDNSATAEFFGTTPEAMADQRASDLGADATTIGRWLAAYDAAIRTGEAAQFDYVQQLETGSCTLSVSVSHIGRAASGRPLCSYVASDVTEERAAARRLARSEQGLQLALRAGQMGAWRIDLDSREVVISDDALTMYGLDPATHTFDDVREHIDPSDFSRVGALFDAAVAAATASGEPQDVQAQYRVRVGDRLRWFRAVGRVYTDDGVAAYMAGTIVDVTVEVEHEASLIEARERARAATREAEASARLRQSILHNMSHEIRTPLTAVIGFADLLTDDACEDDAEIAGYIRSSAMQLLTTLNSVLDHARLEATSGDDGVPLPVEPVDAASTAEGAVALFSQRAQDQGLLLSLSNEGGPCWALADAGSLQRVLANIVSNAVKFTDSGSVAVSTRHDTAGALTPHGDVVLRISDTGIGMGPEFLAAAFQPFQQESTGHSRSHEGTGLGLSIVRRLVEMMGGTVRIDSERGVGTTFEVRLRACPPPPEARGDGW